MFKYQRNTNTVCVKSKEWFQPDWSEGTIKCEKDKHGKKGRICREVSKARPHKPNECCWEQQKEQISILFGKNHESPKQSEILHWCARLNRWNKTSQLAWLLNLNLDQQCDLRKLEWQISIAISKFKFEKQENFTVVQCYVFYDKIIKTTQHAFCTSRGDIEWKMWIQYETSYRWYLLANFSK